MAKDLVGAVKIAQDVLKRLKAKKLNTSAIGYIVKLQNIDLPQNAVSAQKHLPKIEKACSVCALGACFLSYVREYNETTIQEMFYDSRSDRDIIVSKLKPFFTTIELDRIEEAYEGMMHGRSTSSERARAFWVKYPVKQERLKAIMENIVGHGGYFRP